MKKKVTKWFYKVESNNMTYLVPNKREKKVSSRTDIATDSLADFLWENIDKNADEIIVTVES